MNAKTSEVTTHLWLSMKKFIWSQATAASVFDFLISRFKFSGTFLNFFFWTILFSIDTGSHHEIRSEILLAPSKIT